MPQIAAFLRLITKAHLTEPETAARYRALDTAWAGVAAALADPAVGATRQRDKWKKARLLSDAPDDNGPGAFAGQVAWVRRVCAELGWTWPKLATRCA